MQIFNHCSNCDAPLQPFYMQSADGQTFLEIDGCRRCYGLWFDADELEKVLGQPLALKALDSPDNRRCARCKKPMRAWLASTGYVLERCDSCRGLFLDQSELTKLGAPAAEEKALVALSERVTFQCARCEQRFPFAQGNAMGHTLVCGACLPQMTRAPNDPPTQAELESNTAYQVVQAGPGLLDLLWLVALLFP